MYKSYLKIGWRNLSKHKTLSFINIAGLSAGLTCVAFIALWVNNELSYDKFNVNYDRIARVVRTIQTESGTSESALTGPLIAQSLKNNFPETDNAVRLRMRGNIIEHKKQQLYQSGMLLTEPSFFDIFSFRLSKGNEATALSEPYAVVLTESMARKYFGNANPIGETLTIYMYDATGYGAPYKITGVMPDPPENSHFTFTMLVSFSTAETANPEILKDNDAVYYTYVSLKSRVNHQAFSEKLDQYFAKYFGGSEQSDMYSFKTQPLSDIRLYSRLQNEIQSVGDINQVIFFSAIGAIVLILAGMNYVNLSIAASIKRAKEIGVKKVVGALRSQLIMQYLVESVMTTLIALAISLLLSVLFQPLFFQLTGKDLNPFSSPALLPFLAGLSGLLGVLSGLYPAVVLSGFRPLRILKGNYEPGREGVSLRKSMVVAQFTITIVLVTCIIVVNSQMNFVKQKDLGYNKDALIFLRIHGNTDVINGFNGFKNELLTSPLISGIATSNTVPVAGLDMGEFETMDVNNTPIQISAASFATDTKYLNVYGIPLLAGRNFSENIMKDTVQPILINESMVQATRWGSPQAALGKPVKVNGIKGVVIGVMKNFHFSSLHDKIEPLVVYPVNVRFSRITLNANVSHAAEATAWLDKIWKKHFPSALLDFDFVDTQLGEQYRDEERFSTIVLYFSLVAIVIACLGLYGLVSFEASQKVKEIGIRKVLGASVNGIAVMLSKQFFVLVAISVLVAMPVAWYTMSQWLENFAFRTSISWWMFALAGSIVLSLAMLTMSAQVIRAALTNPVNSLKSE